MFLSILFIKQSTPLSVDLYRSIVYLWHWVVRFLPSRYRPTYAYGGCLRLRWGDGVVFFFNVQEKSDGQRDGFSGSVVWVETSVEPCGHWDSS